MYSGSQNSDQNNHHHGQISHRPLWANTRGRGAAASLDVHFNLVRSPSTSSPLQLRPHRHPGSIFMVHFTTFDLKMLGFSFLKFARRHSVRMEEPDVSDSPPLPIQRLSTIPNKLQVTKTTRLSATCVSPELIHPRQPAKFALTDVLSRYSLRSPEHATPAPAAPDDAQHDDRSTTSSTVSTASKTSTTSMTSTSATSVTISSLVPEWMSAVDLEGADLVESTKGCRWKKVGGYIERNGHCIGITNVEHELKMAELQDDHADEVAELKSAYEDQIATLRKQLSAEKKHVNAAKHARAAGQKKVVDQLEAINHLKQEAGEWGGIYDNLTNELRQRDDTNAALRHRTRTAEETANQLAQVDIQYKMSEDNNKVNTRRIQALFEEKFPIEVEITKTRTVNKHLEDRITDLEKQLSCQRDVGQAAAMQQLITENQRLIKQAEDYRDRIQDLHDGFVQQAARMHALEDENNKQFLKLIWSDDELVCAQDELAELRPAAAKVTDLETALDYAYYRLALRYDTHDPAEATADVRIVQYHLRQVREELNAAKHTIAALEQIAEQHTRCQSTIAGLHHHIAKREQVLCAAQKTNNCTFQHYDDLRLKAGLQSLAPPAGAAGMQKIHMRAMFEEMASREGIELTDEDITLCGQQDAAMLEGRFPEQADGLERLGSEEERLLGRPLTAVEKCLPSVMKNIADTIHGIVDDMPIPTNLHPLSRQLLEEENGVAARPVCAAGDTMSILDEIRNESRAKDAQEQYVEPEAAGPSTFNDGVDRKQF
ncbi:hypothetical protein SLS55_003478 [Diplodia seriata]|uniref:Uncharacterized protein n=1 Tax=Diplodia seriata TaxID=420778 RepID=A0ABR3CN29_9PEZI